MGLQSRRPAPRSAGIAAAGVVGLAAGITYSSWLAAPWLNPRVSVRASFVSDLGAAGQPHAGVFNSLDALAGIGIIVLAWGLWRRLGGGRLLGLGCLALAGFGVGSIAEAILPLDCAPSLNAACAEREASGHGISWADRGHTIASVYSIVAVLLSMLFLCWALRHARGWRWPARCWLVAGPLVFLLTAYVGVAALDRQLPGIAERIYVAAFSLWILTLAGALLRSARHP
ncbi:MAG: DUF998 domain-containing protein [Actinomycetota bacterium]|nr:DUF998 domain-containing protein [Actinomycetota bacterium]